MSNFIREANALASLYNVDAYEVHVLLNELYLIHKISNYLPVAINIITYSIDNKITLREALSRYEEGKSLSKLMNTNLYSNKYYTIGKFKIILDDLTEELKVITHENSDCLHIKPSSGNTVILIAHN